MGVNVVRETYKLKKSILEKCKKQMQKFWDKKSIPGVPLQTSKSCYGQVCM